MEGDKETMTVASILESISVIVASAIASFTVIFGINAWKREYLGRRKIELAEEVLSVNVLRF